MWKTPSRTGTGGYALRLGALAMLAVALLYLGHKVFSGTDTIDFKYIHLAGALWQEGVNPYTDAFREAGKDLFIGMNRPQYLLYPPHWWSIAVASAQFGYETAGQIWRIFTAGCMIGGCLLLHDTIRRSSGRPQPWRTWAMLLFACLMSATAITLALGQTSHLLFFGICLFVRAYVSGARGIMALALVVVMLKPNFGLAVALFLLPFPIWWSSLAGGAAITLLLSLPALLPFGVTEVIQGYLHALSQWETLPPNAPLSTTGLRYLAKIGLGLDLPGTWCALTAAALSLCYGAILSRQPALSESPHARAATLGPLLTGLILFIPLHTYDMVVLIPLIALAAALPVSNQIPFFLLMLIALRPNNIATALGLTMPEETFSVGSGLVTFASLLILLMWIARTWRWHHLRP